MLSRHRHLLAYAWPLRIAMGAMFLYSAYPKLRDLEGVVRNVREYNVLPEPLATAYGYALPFGEAALGLLLVGGLRTRLAAAGGVALMASFLVAIAINLVRGDSPECGCFSVEGGSSRLDWTLFVRDVAFLVALLPALLDRERWVSLDRWIASAPGEAYPSDPRSTGRQENEQDEQDA